MAIRKRITKAVQINDDLAIRTALTLAVARVTTANKDLHGSDDEADQTILSQNLSRVSTWERWLASTGELTVIVKST